MVEREVLRVGAVLSSGDWWRRLNAHAADHGSGVEVVVVRDVHAVLESGLQVVCVDDSVLWFNRALVSQAEAAGITVVGVRSTGDPASDDRLAAMGVAYRISDSVAPGLLLDQLTRLRPRDTFDEIVSHLDLVDAAAAGGLLVVGGPPGSGSREVAIGLAAELAAVASTVVVDCNESSPGVARRLGLRLQPHVLDAVEVAAAGGDLRSVLAVPADSLAASELPFDVIVGLPATSEWRRWSPASADVVVGACRTVWHHTVVTTSPVVEDLRRWVDRYGVSRHLLTSSAAVVGVCEATPRGVLRFVDWLAEAQPFSTVLTVVNKVPGSRFASAEVAEQLRSLCGSRIEVVSTLPFDRRVVAAEWDATLPTRGSFTNSIHSLGATVLASGFRSQVEAGRE
jgi:hypothetical protein